MTTLQNVNKKVNAVIEWILNDMQLLNQSARQKLEDELVADLKYYKDIRGNTLKIEVIN